MASFLCDNAGSTCDSQADKGNHVKSQLSRSLSPSHPTSDQGDVGSNPAQGNYSFPQKLSSVEFPVTFSQFPLNLDCCWSRDLLNCSLCLEEKLMIMKGRSKNFLNRRSEMFSKCRHVI